MGLYSHLKASKKKKVTLWCSHTVYRELYLTITN